MYLPLSVSHLAYPSRHWQVVWKIYIGEYKVRKNKFQRKNQDPNFYRASFSNRDNAQVSIHFGRDCQPKNLKNLFFIKDGPIYF